MVIYIQSQFSNIKNIKFSNLFLQHGLLFFSFYIKYDISFIWTLYIRLKLDLIFYL